MSDKSKNYGNLFHLLLGTPESKLSKVFYIVGILGFSLLFLVQMISTVNPSHYYDNEERYGLCALVGMAMGFIAFTFAAAIYVGKVHGKSAFLDQVSFLLKKVFLLLFLPCIVLTILLILWAIITKQPAFT